MNLGFHEQSVAQQLKARGMSGLFELLQSLKGIVLNQQYTLRWLYAVGGQSVLYQAEAPNEQAVIVKIPLLPYHRAAYISIADIQLGRRRLEREAKLLNNFEGSILPKFYELIYSVNPLHPAVRGEEIVNREPYLIMEFVEGQTLLETSRAFHRSGKPDYETLEYLAWSIALTATDFSLKIARRENGYFYSDFSPHNFILTNDSNRSIRILDAGSLVPILTDPTVSPPLTPIYVPPEYYESYKKGEILWPTFRYVLYSLGKVLWEILTNRQPHAAEDPDLSEPQLKHYSNSLQKLLSDLTGGQYDNFEQLREIIKPIPLEQLSSQLTNVFNMIHAKEEDPSTTGGDQGRNVRFKKIHSIHSDGVHLIRLSPDGQHIAIASGKRVELWNINTRRPEKRFQSPHTTPVVSLDFDSTGLYLASGSGEGTICLWQIDTYHAIWQHRGPGFIGWVGLNAQGDLLAAATEWSTATFYPLRTIQKGRNFDGIVDQVNSIATAKKLPLLAVGGLWGLRLWNLTTQSEVGAKMFKAGQGLYVDRIAFGDRDHLLASLNVSLQSMSHASISVWSLPSCELLWQLELPRAKITDFRLASKERLMFASAQDGRIWIWDIEQKMKLALLKETGRVSSLDFTSEHQMFASATLDGEVNLYRMDM